MKPIVYVAGPISADPFGCVRQALAADKVLRRIGCVPWLPQLSVLAEIVEHRDYEEWLAFDFDVIASADAVVRLPGSSPGADREVEFAGSVGLPVFDFPAETEALARWARDFSNLRTAS